MALRVPNRAGFRKPVMIAVCLLLLLFSITAVTHLKLRPKLIETPAPARSATTALSISTAQQPTTQTPNWSYSNANPVQGKTGGNPIRHIIVIFQENRAFDNYFGTYPGAYGIQSGACVPIYPNEKNGTCVKPFRLAPNQASTPDLPHLYKPSLQAMDNGKMDGFIAAAHGCNLTMGYYDSATIPYYWDYARHFVLADHTFQSMVGYSPANHWAMIAALAPLIGFKDWINSSTSYATRYNYTVEADSIPTLTSLMSNSKVSWKYYDQVIPAGKFQQAFGNGTTIDYWNPFLSRHSSYNASMSSHFVVRGQLFTDINSGTLPNVSWVIPSAPISEHAPAKVQYGMWWSARILNYLGTSRYWNNTVVIIVWDDYGGWYDGIAPPSINSSTSIGGTYAQGAGMRVPMLIISPYSKAGYVDHTTYTFSSIMRFVEYTFNLHPLNVRDRTANNILNALNFTQRPLSPVFEPMNLTQTNIVDYWAYNQSRTLPQPPPVTGACVILEANNIKSNQNQAETGFIGGNPD